MANIAADRELRLGAVLDYFKAQRPGYQMSKRDAFDEQATRFDFVGDKIHYMLDLPRNLIDDSGLSEVIARLEESGWWNELQSHRAPEIVTFSFTADGFRLRAA
jgi:hypothetical protein